MRFLVIVFSLAIAAPSHAAQSWLWGYRISETIVDTNRFGQCMVRFHKDLDIPSFFPLCKAQYLTFDCGAELPGSTRINSLEKFESAKMAHALKRKVAVLVTDSQTINGYCFVRQIRVLGS